MGSPKTGGSILESLREGQRVLLLNPPVADTNDAEERQMLRCVEPFGLLRLATWFRRRGCEVELVDAIRDPMLGGQLRRHLRKVLPCGNFDEEGVSKNIYHYGLDEEQLAARLARVAAPDVIAVSSIFTWHVEAVRDTIDVCKRVFPHAKVVLGGNFPTLCPERAGELGAHEVHRGELPDARFLPTAGDLLSDRTTDFLSLVQGCPHACDYCVTPVLNGRRVFARTGDSVFAEMTEKLRSHGTRNFIFYDDFVQFQQSRYLDPFLDQLATAQLGVNVEFALGFAAYMITPSFAARLRNAGIRRVVLALETISEQRGEQMNRPQKIAEFVRAVEILRAHGYEGNDLRAFYLMGLPDQTTDEILRAILFLYELGVTPSLTTYTLIPASGDMARYGERVAGRELDELAPCLWRFAHPGMRVRELDAIYHQFHERYFGTARIAQTVTDDAVINAMQQILRQQRHRPENW